MHNIGLLYEGKEYGKVPGTRTFGNPVQRSMPRHGYSLPACLLGRI
jgi:hypothetical protein